MQTPARTMRDDGFSLVEVMVVIAIIALVSVTAVTQITPPRSALETEAADLVLRLESARRHALASGQPIGFSIDDDGAGYAFMDLHSEGWRVRHGDRRLGATRLEGDVRLRLANGLALASRSLESVVAPDIWFDPSGSEPPIGLVLDGGGASIIISVSSHAQVEAGDAR
ncbi:MAG: GspH/FimT family pseudopilin [Caulobacterales bacterium]|uniref:GspH/FimT family pseudopilin n=1 Tax=Glycocaulis sp. TaxID=1969725 RepID=UPI003FA08C55